MMWPYCIWKPFKREIAKKREAKKHYNSYHSNIFLINWWYNGIFIVLSIIVGVLLITFGIIFLYNYYGHTPTWTVIDKDTGIKYKNAIENSYSRTGACTDNKKEYPIFWERSDNDENIKDGSITMSVNNKEITITHYDKIDEKDVLTRDYCKENMEDL